MQFGRLFRRTMNAVLPPALFLALTGYFGWQATQGAHGLHSYHQQLQLLDDARESQKNAVEEQTAWRRRVSGLSEGALNGDMLDERARAMLNLANPNDIVVPYDKHDQLY
ncbi:FtsB family cell division protein [Acetobacter fallax]|uniref:Septation inhibitor protein n=1 Tax=Acetobacter fallax TaxID=1737473 RepID=A0ABX0KE32_9PROT|nr:septum formation initiator family protein [Acetobacter fallax]NHO33852.1 septation inhibitor protein [Acetobacter fallax]NHO37412.1 septation inhibitor protein [Acetobacter fallax]